MKVVDLSLSIQPSMPGVEIETAKTLEKDGWNATTLRLYSHCGTHMDAPRHFLTNGATLEQLDLSILIGPAIVVDLAPAQPRQAIRVADLASVREFVTPGCRMLFRTDWYKRYGRPEYRDALPRISLELAEWLVDKRVGLIGVEPPSVADVNNMSELTQVHQTLFRGNVVIVEGLANLDHVSERIVQFIALPLKVEGGDGSPVRAVAITGKHSEAP